MSTAHILVLHGRQQCGVLFHGRIKRVWNILSKECDLTLHFPDAPYELELLAGDDLRTRSWWNKTLDESWDIILAHLQEYLSDHNIHEVRGIIGFSQGGALAAALACRLPTLQEAESYTYTILENIDAPQLAHSMKLQFLVIAGAPFVNLNNVAICTIPSLHFIGEADTIVPQHSSRLWTKCFQEPIVNVHDKAHIFPSRVEEIDFLLTFIKSAMIHPSFDPSTEVQQFEPTEEQLEEVECLESIYDDRVRIIQEKPPMVAIKLIESHETTERATGHLLPTLTITMTKNYPDSPPILEVSHIGPFLGVKDGSDAERSLAQEMISHLMNIAQENAGMSMIVLLVDEASIWLESIKEKGFDVDNPAPVFNKDNSYVLQTEVRYKKQLWRSLPNSTTNANHQVVGFPSTDSAVGQEHTWTKQEAVAQMQSALLNEDADAYHNLPDGDCVTQPFHISEREWSDIIRKLHEKVAAEYPAGIKSQQDEGGTNASSHHRGCWKYTIGLVGKPSAGKSTLFNAITDPKTSEQEAQVASYAFTTIDPNVGQGYFTVACPSSRMKGIVSSPSHGFAAHQRRRVPIVIKDVAGLVPGAYRGRGKGNAFLNDLCDADVLIHVVDASGMSDEQGTIDKQCSRDPAEDVFWVREEIHRWIFNNVCAKWSKCLRGIDHFVSMFSGYQAQPEMVYESIRRSGFSLQDIEAKMQFWGPHELHHVIANFLRIRFPILLALNKVDKSIEFVNSLLSAFPNDIAVPICAGIEWRLCQLRRKGIIHYETGDSSANIGLSYDTSAQRDKKMADVTLDLLRKLNKCPQLKGTGVWTAVNEAVLTLRPPVIVYPVVSFETMCSIPIQDSASRFQVQDPSTFEKKSLHKQSPVCGILTHCLLLQPHLTVDSLYEILKHPPLEAVSGDFVRAEYYDFDQKTSRVLKRADQITNKQCIIRILTNKKRVHGK